MIKKDDIIFQLVSLQDDNNDEFTYGFYSSQELANEQKEECEQQAEEQNLCIEYMVKRHRILL